VLCVLVVCLLGFWGWGVCGCVVGVGGGGGCGFVKLVFLLLLVPPWGYFSWQEFFASRVPLCLCAWLVVIYFADKYHHLAYNYSCVFGLKVTHH